MTHGWTAQAAREHTERRDPLDAEIEAFHARTAELRAHWGDGVGFMVERQRHCMAHEHLADHVPEIAEAIEEDEDEFEGAHG